MAHMDSFPYLHQGSKHQYAPTYNKALMSPFSPNHVTQICANKMAASGVAYTSYHTGFEKTGNLNMNQHHVIQGQTFGVYPVNYTRQPRYAGGVESSMDTRYHAPAAVLPTIYDSIYSSLDCHHPGYRKNVTKETTGPLKAWLMDHRKNPYPTKAEKIMLAIITKMTLTQVSTWFANARRRLKKETGGAECDITEDDKGRSSLSPDNTHCDIEQNEDMYEVCVDDVSDNENDESTSRCDDVTQQNRVTALDDSLLNMHNMSNVNSSTSVTEDVSNENNSCNLHEISKTFPVNTTNQNCANKLCGLTPDNEHVRLQDRSGASNSDSTDNTSSKRNIWSISNILGL